MIFQKPKYDLNRMPEFQTNEFYLTSIDIHAFVIEYQFDIRNSNENST